MNKNTKIKIKAPKIVQPNSKKGLWIFLAVLITLCASNWFSYHTGLAQSSSVQNILQGTDKQVNEQLLQLAKKNAFLEQQLTILVSENKIDDIALKKVRADIAAQQQKELKLKKENQLLNTLVSDEKATDALRILDLKLSKTDTPNNYAYGFTVTHIQQNDKEVRGRVTLAVNGTLNGDKTHLNLEVITRKNSKQLALKFHHFQRIEGEIQLPKKFKATSIIIKAIAVDAKIKTAKERFNWSLKEF